MERDLLLEMLCPGRKGGKEKYVPTLLAATLGAPGHHRAVPVPLGFVVPEP
jgi:hypothetical protein